MNKSWWKNSRGELFVIAQFITFSLIAFAPRTISALPEWNSNIKCISSVTGGFLLAAGIVIAAAGTIHLGRNLTPFICPKEGAILLEKGAYRLVRHPIYCGLLMISLGWGFWVHGELTLCYGMVLFLIFGMKAKREEQLLSVTFPGYAEYSRRVKRLIPFIY